MHPYGCAIAYPGPWMPQETTRSGFCRGGPQLLLVSSQVADQQVAAEAPVLGGDSVNGAPLEGEEATPSAGQWFGVGRCFLAEVALIAKQTTGNIEQVGAEGVVSTEEEGHEGPSSG